MQQFQELALSFQTMQKKFIVEIESFKLLLGRIPQIAVILRVVRHPSFVENPP